jgi:hypothetical protein
MVPATLIALALMAAGPAADPAPAPAPAVHAPLKGPHAVAAAVSESGDDDAGDIPPGAPTDDYGFVAWCYGALGEYLTIYQQVIPDLKDIDKLFGTSVQEDEPYSADVAAERVALKRFGAALDAAERASPTPIATQGAASIQAGRGIWSAAKLQPHRKLADAWLFWGIPKRCETAAKALKARSIGHGQTLAAVSPSAIELAAAEPAPGLDDRQAKALEAASAPPAPVVPAGPPPAPRRAGAVLIDAK